MSKPIDIPDSPIETGSEATPWQFIKIGKNSIFYWLASLIPQMVGFVLLPVYTRYVTTTDYGILAMLGALASPLGFFFTLQLNTAVLRFFFAYEGEERRKYLGTMFIFLLIWAGIIALALVLFGKPLFRIFFKSEDLVFYPYIVWQIVITFLNLFWIIPSVVLKAKQQGEKWLGMMLISFVLGTALTYYFIIVPREGALGVVRASLITQSIMTVPYLIITLRNISFTFQLPRLKESMAFCAPLMPAYFFTNFFTISDRWFIERFRTLAEVGLYSLASKFSQLEAMLYNAIGEAWMPVFFNAANRDEARAKKLLSTTTTLWTVGGGFITLGISFFSREVIELMTTSQYHEAYAVVPLMAFNILLMGIRFFPRYALLFKKKTGGLMLLTPVYALIMAALNFLLVPRYGIFGAAYASIIANLVTTVVTNYLVQKHFPMRFEYAKLAKTMVMIVALLAGVYFFATESWYINVPLKLAALAAYCLFLVYSGVIERSLLVQIKSGFNWQTIKRALKE